LQLLGGFLICCASLSRIQKGDVFERLVQLYLLTKPKYRTELSAVWIARSEVPERLSPPPRGIDIKQKGVS
jgi:hypothetical protein